MRMKAIGGGFADHASTSSASEVYEGEGRQLAADNEPYALVNLVNIVPSSE